MAATGSLVGSKCFAASSDAVDAFYSAVGPGTTPGSTSYVSEFWKVSGVWKYKRWSVSSGGAVTELTVADAPVPTFPACDPASPFIDGVSVGWGIAGALILAAAVVHMRKAARG